MTLFVAGSLHLDVVMRAPHLPAPDETVTGSSVDYVFGGKGGNQALAAARMGAKVHFAGRAGSDEFGETLRGTLAEANIETSQLQTDPGPSGMSSAIVEDSGDYGAVIVSAANLNIDQGQISIPKNCKIVLLQNEIPEHVNIDVARKAKATGAQVWLNAAPARELARDFLELIDLLIVNRIEAAFYSDLPAKMTVLKTLGEDGVDYQSETHAGYTINTVSTHGAGDMFVGALAAQVIDGAAIEAALPFAQAAAALHVSTELSERSQISQAKVKAFLDAHTNR